MPISETWAFGICSYREINSLVICPQIKGAILTIAKKINFANVVGDGNCIFTFKVNERGELIEKKFVSTTNSSLSDEVYEALLNVNSYTAPPNGYKPTTLRFSVKMYNSNFEVSLN